MCISLCVFKEQWVFFKNVQWSRRSHAMKVLHATPRGSSSDLGLHAFRPIHDPQEPCNDLELHIARQSQAMGWEIQVAARREPCNDPACSLVEACNGQKDLGRPSRTSKYTEDSADPVPARYTATDPKMNWAWFLAPVPSSSFPSLGPALTRPGPQTGT